MKCDNPLLESYRCLVLTVLRYIYFKATLDALMKQLVQQAHEQLIFWRLSCLGRFLRAGPWLVCMLIRVSPCRVYKTVMKAFNPRQPHGRFRGFGFLQRCTFYIDLTLPETVRYMRCRRMQGAGRRWPLAVHRPSSRETLLQISCCIGTVLQVQVRGRDRLATRLATKCCEGQSRLTGVTLLRNAAVTYIPLV